MKRIKLLDLAVPLRSVALVGTALLVIAGAALVLRFGSPATRAADEIDVARGAVQRARDKPWSIAPARLNLIEMTPADIDQLDRQIRPPSKLKPNSSTCLHLLRAHNMRGRFEGMEPSSSDAILKVLTDEKAGSTFFGQSPLVVTRSGVRYVTMEGGLSDDPSMEQHRDHSLSAFAELGVPLSRPLTVGGTTRTLRDVLRDSVDNFHLGQEEIAWTAIAYALYLPPVRAWVNRYGERFTFDDLAAELERRPLDKASCGGTHLLFALALLGRVNQEAPVLSDDARGRLFAHLARCVRVAERTQQPDGSWPAWWNHELLAGGRPIGGSIPDDDTNRLLMTGHLAELLLYLPAEIGIPQPALRRAGRWLQKRVLAAGRQDKEIQMCPFTHAVCALKQISFVPTEVVPRRSAKEGAPGRTS